MLKSKVIKFAENDKKIGILEREILNTLETGERNAITCARFSREHNCPKRRFTLAVCRLRDLGYPIVSTTKGFFYPDNREEVSHFSASMHSREIKISRSCKWADRMLSAWMPGQQRFDLDATMARAESGAV